jgi:hypothetical protein
MTDYISHKKSNKNTWKLKFVTVNQACGSGLIQSGSGLSIFPQSGSGSTKENLKTNFFLSCKNQYKSQKTCSLYYFLPFSYKMFKKLKKSAFFIHFSCPWIRIRIPILDPHKSLNPDTIRIRIQNPALNRQLLKNNFLKLKYRYASFPIGNRNCCTREGHLPITFQCTGS